MTPSSSDRPFPDTNTSPLTDNRLEGKHTSLVLRMKYKIASNALRNIKKHLYLHFAVGFGLVFFLVGGGTAIFLHIFDFLMNPVTFGPFGATLMDRLVGIVFLIFFSMLLFSNLIITLSTTYISREVEFLMGLPISRQSIFRQKLVESIVYSSWAFALLTIPIFASYGVSRDAVWYFYPLVILLVIPFITIPATLGAIVTMVMTSFLPARKTRTLCIGLGILAIIAMVVLARYTGIGRLLATANSQDFLQMVNALAFGSSPLMPNAWLTSGLQAIAPANVKDIDLGEYLYWLAMLSATALFLLEVCRWLVPPLYYRGWCLSRDAAVREVESQAVYSPFRYIDKALLSVFRSPTAGLLSKDLKTFWRDPSQWTQLVILFGLMVVYISNLGWSTRATEALEFVVNDWKKGLAFFNLAATCFILSILTTRFVYPMLSLEGRGFWTVGLAPIPRTQVVWQKYVLCFILCVTVSVPLTLLSCYILQVDASFVRLSLGTVVLMSAGLTSLSVGFGAMLPDFKEDNPARIANGVGGTLNVLVSLLYISVTVILLAIPVLFMGTDGMIASFVARWFVPYVGLTILVQLLFIVMPLRIGLHRWNNMEF